MGTRRVKKFCLLSTCAILAGMLTLGCSTSKAEVKQEVVDSKKVVVDNLKTEKDLGYRTESLFTEKTVQTQNLSYSKTDAGTSKKIERAFDNAPPMIPHSVEGLLPITTNNNACIGCHMPEVASSMGAVAIPASHFTNYRNNEKLKDLYQGRFNCSQCHAPQVKGDVVVNNFEGGFRDKNGQFSSNLADTINEGIDAN